MVHEPKKNFYKKFLHEPFPVESSLQGQLHDHINAEIASASLLNIGDCIEWLTWTYFFRRLVMNPSYYQLDSTTPEGVQLYLSGLIDGVLKDLTDAGCVTMKNDFDLAPTTLGKISSYYYLDYRTVAMFKRELDKWPAPAEDASEDEALYADISTLTLLLCNAYEFSELPVRHNEEILNAELAEDLPWYTDNLDKECPHTKAYLLLQAHFFRVKLPITDYINDTKSVLDQAPRVLNAMIDIAADSGYLRICTALMAISKMILQVISSLISCIHSLPYFSHICSHPFLSIICVCACVLAFQNINPLDSI
jgi:replicative superfamily II helicase